MLEDNYITKKSVPENQMFSNTVLVIGAVFFIVPLLLVLSTFKAIIISGLSFMYIFEIIFFSLFTIIGLGIILYGLIEKYGEKTLVLDDLVPVSKDIKIANYLVLKKDYKSIRLVLSKEEFPNLKYPGSVLICKNSEKNIKSLGNIKDGFALLKNVNQMISSISQAKDLTNHIDVFLIAVLYLWANQAIHLISYKAADELLGFKFWQDKKRYMFIQGENLQKFYQAKTTGIIEKSILNFISCQNESFTYEDNDLQTITKKIISTKSKYPERLFPDMARNQAKELDLIVSNDDYQYLIKEEYTDLFEQSHKEIYLYIANLAHKYPEFIVKFREDIQLGVKAMDNSD